ncbi:Gfo/Idh/MocA family oxidoreductase [Rhodobacterales bacterium HKCCE3408]|nr:Gfo/Idh/MocA family oxidoreductase [Rhodobacterales bacterium HKCCE3408]
MSSRRARAPISTSSVAAGGVRFRVTVTEIAIAGFGKIARDQHVPSIARSDAFRLAATVSRNARADGIPAFGDIADMIAARPDVTAVALCMPPQARFGYAVAAIEAGLDVLLEKPPGASVAEVKALTRTAKAKGCVLFATWHSRFAAGVSAAKAWLATRRVLSARITWREDVRHWHPGQDWIWEPGGLGVFDPGINALSILTEILPVPVHVTDAELEFPANRATPIAARLTMYGAGDVIVAADFDWRQTGPQTWDIEVETDVGTLRLSKGGAEVEAAGRRLVAGEALQSEYDGLYSRFAHLLARRESEVDVSPLVHVADAFMLARRIETDPFHD